jgi:hypothetical protein
MRRILIIVINCILFSYNLFAQKDTSFQSTGNPIITHKCTADAAALVYKDKVYLYTGHDVASPKKTVSFHRSVCIDYLYYNKDGTIKRVIMTS